MTDSGKKIVIEKDEFRVLLEKLKQNIVNEIKRPKEEIKTAYIRTIRKLNKKRAAQLTGLP